MPTIEAVDNEGTQVDILLISDQPLTVLALRAVLGRHEAVADVVDASHLAEAMSMLSTEHAYQLLLLDLDTHGVRPVSTTALLRELWPQIPLALLMSRDRDASEVRAVGLGVSGYLSKTAAANELRDAVRKLTRGERVTFDVSLAH
jgi:DNA-binding NarL/FixJ family response regulator